MKILREDQLHTIPPRRHSQFFAKGTQEYAWLQNRQWSKSYASSEFTLSFLKTETNYFWQHIIVVAASPGLLYSSCTMCALWVADSQRAKLPRYPKQVIQHQKTYAYICEKYCTASLAERQEVLIPEQQHFTILLKLKTWKAEMINI